MKVYKMYKHNIYSLKTNFSRNILKTGYMMYFHHEIDGFYLFSQFMRIASEVVTRTTVAVRKEREMYYWKLSPYVEPLTIPIEVQLDLVLFGKQLISTVINNREVETSLEKDTLENVW